MTDDQLRQLLETIDPVPGPAALDLADWPRVRGVLGAVTTTTDEGVATASRHPSLHRPRHLRGLALAAVAVACLVAVVAVSTGLLRDDASTPTRRSLATPGGATMTSCIPFDVEALARMPVAFGGTVSAVDDTTVTLRVDRWYRTGDAAATDEVELTTADPATSASLDGVDFVVGRRYLLTAAGGTVNGCGFSGLATAELEAAFVAAFG